MKQYISIIFYLSMAVSTLSLSARDDKGERVRDFIREQMPLSVRVNTVDTLGKIGLPYPYSVPCVQGMFQDMFYWDTYFTNLGLISIGDTVQAKNNVDNILYVINLLGYMPNATDRGMFNRSQPPYASMMVADIYDITHDKEWLGRALPVLEKEYGFWMTRRITQNGLNRYGNSATDKELSDFYGYMTTRFPHLKWEIPDSERIRQGSHFLSEAESGWDFTPRFDFRCEDFNPVDLNSNLYIYEKNFERFYKELGLKNSKKWAKIADKRAKLMRKLLKNPADGLYYDYDFINARLSPVYSSSIFNLMWAGLLTGSEAKSVMDNLSRLEMAYGVVACEPADRNYTYQWDAPNAWASFNVLAVMALDRYGYKDDARRIAEKYVRSIDSIYRSTGNLWEKFNGMTGSIDVNSEYEMPPFMGWTAGAYMYSSDYLRNNQ